MTRRLGTLALLFTAALGCEGLSLGENTAGGDTHLGYGAIAVDDETEAVFVLRTLEQTSSDGAVQEEKHLLRVDPDGSVAPVIDLTGYEDPRILFPRSGILIMAEREEQERLLLYDRSTWALKEEQVVGSRYWGTRLSPSRRWLVVADSAIQPAAIHLVDTETLTVRTIPQPAPWIEAMWSKTEDTLYVMAGQVGADAAGEMHLLAYPIDALVGADFQVGADGFWEGALWHRTVEQAYADLLFSFSWVGVDPTGRAVAFPMRRKLQDNGTETMEKACTSAT